MAQPTAADLRAFDRSITDNLLTMGEDMTQSIYSTSFTPAANNNVINIPMRPVGLTRGFLVKIAATFTNSGSGVATLTPFGAANILSNVTLTDLDQYQRINDAGWHLNLLNSAKEGFPFGAALLAASTDTPIKYGNNFSVMSASATVASGGGTGQISMYFWVPCAYGKHDLRGAIYTGVVNATGFLALTLNTNLTSGSGDGTLTPYSGANSVMAYTNATVTVYQNFIDQIPVWQSGPDKGKPQLPPLSMQTQYRLVGTSLAGMTPNQAFPIPFTNFQSFLSAAIIYDQAGTLNAGTDITQFTLAAANTLQFFALDPFTQALRQRIRFKTDTPIGSYFFDFREQPINTNQAGNIQLTMQPSSVAVGSNVLVGWEAFANVNTVLGAQSLAAS